MSHKKVIARSQYNSDRVACVVETSNDHAQQHFAAECNINNIIARYFKTGELPLNKREPVYIEVPSMEYKTMCDLVRNLTSAYDSLPRKLRDEIGGAANFVEFVLDSDHVDILVEHGLAVVTTDPDASTEAKKGTGEPGDSSPGKPGLKPDKGSDGD